MPYSTYLLIAHNGQETTVVLEGKEEDIQRFYTWFHPLVSSQYLKEVETTIIKSRNEVRTKCSFCKIAWRDKINCGAGGSFKGSFAKSHSGWALHTELVSHRWRERGFSHMSPQHSIHCFQILSRRAPCEWRLVNYRELIASFIFPADPSQIWSQPL